MKGLTLILFIGLFLISCSKNTGTSDTSSLILGKWNVTTDLTLTGIGMMNHTAIYTGQSGDYFDFRADSSVYTKEGSVYDTLKYNIVSNSTIIIAKFGLVMNGIPQTCQITNLTLHNATITAANVITPAGEFGRTLELSR